MDAWMKDPNFSEENPTAHYCVVPYRYFIDGPAVDECFEDSDGCLFVSNGDNGSQVNFCPMCGYEAIIKIE